MEPGEQLFLNFISNFTVEDIKQAIFSNMDLAAIAREEIPDYVEGFRDMVRAYDKEHPERRQQAQKDYQAAAIAAVDFLKHNRPDLGYEIETYVQRPTAQTIGLRTSSAVPATALAEHAGLAWVAKNIKALMDLFFT